MKKSNSDAESFLLSAKTQIKDFSDNFLESQRNLEFWSEFSDMINEKSEEIMNAKAKLKEIKEKFSEKLIALKIEEFNEFFLETDGVPFTSFSSINPLKNINLISSKIDARLNLLNNMKKIKKFQRNTEENYDSLMSSDEGNDEKYGEIYQLKSQFYEVAEDIMREIDEEFKSIPVFVKKFENLNR